MYTGHRPRYDPPQVGGGFTWRGARDCWI